MNGNLTSAEENLFRIYAVYGEDGSLICAMKAACGSIEINPERQRLSNMLRQCFRLHHHQGGDLHQYSNPANSLVVLYAENAAQALEERLTALEKAGFILCRLQSRLSKNMIRTLPHMILMSADRIEELNPHFVDACISAIEHDAGLAKGAERAIRAIPVPDCSEERPVSAAEAEVLPARLREMLTSSTRHGAH